MLGGNPARGSTPATNLLYTGEQWDNSAQMYYLRARYYDPLNGRFNQVDPFAGNNSDPQSLHKYLYCHANPVNGADPSGNEFTLMGMITVATITMTVMSLAFPVLGAAYLSIRGKLSFSQVLSHLFKLETWAVATASLLVGAGIAIGINILSLFAAKIGITAAKKLVSFVGLFSAIIGIVQSIRMTWNMVTGRLPAAHAEIYIATMIAGIMITILIGKVARSGRLREWFGRGSENDAEFWRLDSDEQAAYNRGQQLLPSDVYNELAGLAPTQRGHELGKAWISARGFWEALRNQITGSGFSISDWLSTGPTPDIRFVFGQSTEIFSAAVAGLEVGGEMYAD